MDVVLPKEIAYSPSLPSLPECITQEVVISPSNGNLFGPSSLLQFDLTSRGFIDPQSIYIRFKLGLANNAGETSIIRGAPLYSMFSKLETIFGSQTVESINNYNQVCNMMLNMQNTVSDKYGLQSAYGYSTTTATPSIEELDCRYCATNEGVDTTGGGFTAASAGKQNMSFAGALPCLLSMSEKLIPAGLMSNIRIQLTTAAINDIFCNGTPTGGTAYTPPTNYRITNCELCYTMIDFSSDVTEMVKQMGDQFYIKSTSWQNMGNTLPNAFSGATELIFNMRLASIKSLFAAFSGPVTTCTNGLMDSVDVTSANGEYNFTVAGTSYPSRPYSTLNNRAAGLMEIKKACGALHSTNYNFSINTLEWNALESTVTAPSIPGKFFFAQNLEKLSSNGVLLSGISTQSSPITLRISTGTTTTRSFSVNLMAMYDVLIQVDPINRAAIVKQ